MEVDESKISKDDDEVDDVYDNLLASSGELFATLTNGDRLKEA